MSDTSHLRSTLIMGASVVALSAISAPAFAQVTAPVAPAPAGAVGGGADVIVTAEHRQTRLQKIPVAVSVFTGASRDRLGISTVQDVTNFAPGFVYDPSTVHAYIRGVGRQSINVTNDQRVATYEDEFYVYSPYGLDKSSLFLSQEQIERGPQNVGGRNAAAGSIDMISVRPTETPYAEVRATIENFNHYEVEGAASDQVLPGLTARLAGYWNSQNQGFYHNVTGQPSEGNEIQEWYIEGQADLKLGSNADLWARTFFSGWNNRGDAGARSGPNSNGSWDETNLTDANEYPGAGLFVSPNYGYAGFAGPARAGANPNDVLPLLGMTTLANPNVFNNPTALNPNNFAAIQPRTNTLKGYDDINYIFTYHFPSVDFRYIGGWQGYNYDLNFSEPDTNVTGYVLPGSTATPALELAGLSAFPGCAACSFTGGPLPAATNLGAQSTLPINPLVHLEYIEDDSWWSQEASFQSTGDSPFQWVAGGFYYHQHYRNPITAEAPGQPQFGNPDYVPPGAILSAVCPGFFCGFDAGVAAPANPHHYLFLQDYAITVQTESAYAQASFKINDQFKVTGNLRYTNDHKFGTEDSRYVFFGSAIIDGLSPFFGAATPAIDITPSQTCASGNPAHCDTGPLAKGVTSLGVIGPDGIIRRRLGDTSHAWTGGAGIEWTPTNDIFMYARYGRGYEDMTFNAGFTSANPDVGPEYLDSYEVGYKQNFGSKLSIDIAAFYYNYVGLQLPISVANGGVTSSEFINVPKAVSTGVEFEGVWNPVKDLLITASYSFDYTAIQTGCTGTLDTAGSLTPAPRALCIIDTNDPAAVQPTANNPMGQTTGTVDQSVKGDPLPNAPRNKLAISAAYTWHFDPGNLTLTGAYVWRDTQQGTVFNTTYDRSPSWSDVDLRAVWSGDHDRYEVIGFVKNLFNTLQYETGAAGAGLAGNATSAVPGAKLDEVSAFNLAPPRQFGVEVRYKFF